MLKYFFAFILLIHGLIHITGFVKAFNLWNISALTKEISKPAGLLWLAASLLFITAFVLLLLKNESWPAVAGIAVLLSQILIFSTWQDAKFGSIANLLIVFVAIASWTSLNFEAQFRNDVKANLALTKNMPPELLKETDIQQLPEPVQKYLRYSGAIHEPKIKNIRIAFEGEMREKGKEWFSFQSVQYNFFAEPARLFFMKAQMFGVTVPGYHNYQHAIAKMDVKIFGLFPVVKLKGTEMNKAETVTVFNDMCLLAPASLIDKRIEWMPVDKLSTAAIFTIGTNSIKATLLFNEEGQLINFISDDRYAIGDMKKYRFSTPVSEYGSLNGRNVLQSASTIWQYPEGEFVYGKFRLKNIAFNVTE